MSVQNAQYLRKLADEYEALLRVAAAADRWMQHVAGYHITLADGTITDVFNSTIPEAHMLYDALADWRRVSA